MKLINAKGCHECPLGRQYHGDPQALCDHPERPGPFLSGYKKPPEHIPADCPLVTDGELLLRADKTKILTREQAHAEKLEAHNAVYPDGCSCATHPMPPCGYCDDHPGEFEG